MRLTTALILATALLAAPAQAATYTFSFEGSAANPGTVSGLIGGLSDDGLGQLATSVFVTSVTGSAGDFSSINGINFAAPRVANPDQYIFFDSRQRFDVANGVIGLGEFAILSLGYGIDGPNPQLNDFANFLCFFSASSAEKGCPGFLSVRTTNILNVFTNAEVTRSPVDGPSVTFSRLPDQPSPVPLPASVGLLASALILIGLLSRPGEPGRRRKIA